MNDLTNPLYEKIRDILLEAKHTIAKVVNTTMVRCYFEIGRTIVEDELCGKSRAGYGTGALSDLSKRLSFEFGKGFSEANLSNMKSFFLIFQNHRTMPDNLSWSHYTLLMRLDNESARSFYMKEASTEKWSVRELDRQINSMLFERLALNKDKAGVMALARQGQIIEKPSDLIKEPCVLEFLNLPENHIYTEHQLETAIIDDLHNFLLEFGKGFSFVARQKRITLDGDHYYVDLVFYNRLLQCFVLLDLKIGKLTHQDLGQMQMYVNFFDREIKTTTENSTIGIVLCRDKKEAIVKYTLPENNKQIFASKYQLYLPTEAELVCEVNALVRRLEK